jgi:hypothetical protein
VPSQLDLVIQLALADPAMCICISSGTELVLVTPAQIRVLFACFANEVSHGRT